MARLIPIHILAAPSLIDVTAIVPSLYEPEEFAALYHADKQRAIALVATMSEPQKVRQALAYAAWLAYHGLEIDVETVLAAWEVSKRYQSRHSTMLPFKQTQATEHDP
jgi:hypothetical protein